MGDVVQSTDELIAAIRERIRALGLRHLEVDELCGLQVGYTGKLLCGAKGIGPKSLDGLLSGLGIGLVVVDRALSTVAGESVGAQGFFWRQKELEKKNWRAKGGRRRWGEYLPEERKKIMRKVTMARVRKAAQRKNSSGG